MSLLSLLHLLECSGKKLLRHHLLALLLLPLLLLLLSVKSLFKLAVLAGMLQVLQLHLPLR
jgi:hypothetical protein